MTLLKRGALLGFDREDTKRAKELEEEERVGYLRNPNLQTVRAKVKRFIFDLFESLSTFSVSSQACNQACNQDCNSLTPQ